MLNEPIGRLAAYGYFASIFEAAEQALVGG
jgi:hypothetical protein